MLAAVTAATAEGLLATSSAVNRVAASLRRGLHRSQQSPKTPSSPLLLAFAVLSPARTPTTSAPAALGGATSAAVLSRNHRHGHRVSRVPAVVMAMPSSTSAASASASAASSSGAGGATLDTLPFDNVAIRELPIDVDPDNYIRSVSNACFSVVAPDPVVKPVLVAASSSALGLLGLGPGEAQRDDAAEYFSGKLPLFRTFA